jgi:choline dehydrogenase-like flavoprotein
MLMNSSCYFTTTLLLKPKAEFGAQGAITVTPDPLQAVGPQCPMAWLSSPAVKSSPEFFALPKETQSFLEKVPSFEFITTNVPMGVGVHEKLAPNSQVITFIAALMNTQSSGSITLSSANPSEPPLIDVGYVSHPYDRRVAIESLRAIIEYSNMPTFATITERRIEGPEGDSDEDIFDHVKKSVSPVFHYGGTCRMGRVGDEKTVVDKNFKVVGVKGLRVADHSVAPLMVNNHTQSTAYLIVSLILLLRLVSKNYN